MEKGRHEESERSLGGSDLLREYFDLFFVFCRPTSQERLTFRYSINCEMHCSCISMRGGGGEIAKEAMDEAREV